VVALVEGMRAGELFPRWSPELAYGLGYPFFDFYGPLAFYAASALHLLGLPIVESIKATQLLGFVLCSTAMFGFARRHLGDAGALVAAAAYGYAPYHIVNVYARGDSLGEFTAMALLPLVLWALERALAGSPRGALALALAFAALILSHNLSALLSGPLLALTALLTVLRTRSPRGLWFGLGGGLLAVALTCFYWLPALWDRRYVHLEHVTTGYFDFRNHFLALSRLVQPSPLYDYGLDGTSDGALPFQVGLAQALVALAGLAALRHRRAWPIGSVAVLAALGYLALASPGAQPLWERLPTLQIVQFPWRALAGASFGLALLAGLPALVLRERVRALWAIAAVGAVALAGSLGASPERWRIPPEDVTVENVQRYEYVTSAIGSTVRYEYLPLEAKERPWASAQVIAGQALPRARFPAGTATVRRDGIGFVVAAASAGGGTLTLEHHFYPGWTASLPLRASDPEGFLQVDLPPGAHEVRFGWGETRLRQAARLVSLGALALLLVAAFAARRRPPAATPPTPTVAAAPRTAVVLAAGALALLALRLPWTDLLQPTPASGPEGDRRFTHAHAPWPYVEPNGVHVGIVSSGPWLESYRQRPEVVAGERQRVELTWRGGSGGGLSARIRHSAEVILAADRNLAWVDLNGPVVELDVPPSTAPGMYQVEVFDPWRGGSAYLVPFRVLPPPTPPARADRPGLARFGDQLALESVELTRTWADLPAFRLRWRALRAPDHDWRVSVRLVDDQGNLWGAQDGRPVDGFYPTYLWPAGAVVDDRRDVATVAGTPPGPYRLEVRVYSLAGRALDVVDARGAAVAPLYRGARFDLTPGSPPPEAAAQPLALVESRVEARHADAGARVPVSLLFRAGEPPGRDLDLLLQLGPVESRVPFGFPASQWRRGELVRAQHALLVPPELPAGRHPLSARLLDPAGRVALGPLDLGEVEVRNRPRRFDPPAPRVAVGALFGGEVELVGFDAPDTRARPGGQVAVTLWWRGRAPTETSYTVFLHLLDAERRVRGQVDRVPGDGALPTSGWAVGEVVEDRYVVPLDASAPPGPYVLEVGLYDARTGQRLSVDGGGDHLDLVGVGVE
jgi:hypothetical protein